MNPSDYADSRGISRDRAYRYINIALSELKTGRKLGNGNKGTDLSADEVTKTDEVMNRSKTLKSGRKRTVTPEQMYQGKRQEWLDRWMELARIAPVESFWAVLGVIGVLALCKDSRTLATPLATDPGITFGSAALSCIRKVEEHGSSTGDFGDFLKSRAFVSDVFLQ